MGQSSESVKLSIMGFSSFRFMDDLSSLIMLEAVREYGFTTGAVLSFRVKSRELNCIFHEFGHVDRWRAVSHENGVKMGARIDAVNLWDKFR